MDSTVLNLGKNIGQSVTLKGWAYNFRSSGSICFVQFRDGTGEVQIIVSKNDVDAGSWQAAEQLTIESSIIVTGTVSSHPKNPDLVEVHAQSVQLVQRAEEYPISKKEHGPEFLFDERHLWIRSNTQQAILRIRDAAFRAITDFMHERGFIRTDSPILTGNAAEGTTTLFEIDYFGEKAYLAQTGQLYLEATSAALGRTYCFGPTFRAEKSKTRRHLTEFWMFEAEASFMEQPENIQLQEDMMVYVVQRVLKECAPELTTLERDTTALQTTAQGNFPRIHYRDAVQKLKELGSDMQHGDDFGADDETMLTKEFDRPIFITHFPAKIKAFYMKPDPNEPDYALCADLLAPEGYGEIIGGSQRIDDLKLLEQRLEEHKLPKAAFEWYLDLRRFGSVPHAGFGLGLERIVTWICGRQHVREAIPFPRTINRLQP
ncbi:MAG: asparagine--tRNA ligase [bacterium]|nr:asparagine--tRNA ligase [bacterium]